MLKSSKDYEPGVGIDLSRENVVQVYDVQYGADFSNWGVIMPWMINRSSNKVKILRESDINNLNIENFA